jgi:hypothetical protein
LKSGHKGAYAVTLTGLGSCNAKNLGAELETESKNALRIHFDSASIAIVFGGTSPESFANPSL